MPRAEAKEKKKALAEHLARHPEDVGRTVEDFNWILQVIVRPAVLGHYMFGGGLLTATFGSLIHVFRIGQAAHLHQLRSCGRAGKAARRGNPVADLLACDVFVLLVSANSMGSDYVIDKELQI